MAKVIAIKNQLFKGNFTVGKWNIFDCRLMHFILAKYRDSGPYTYKYTVKMYTTEPLKTDAYLPDKTWTITFNSEVDAHTVSEDTIYVIDENSHKVEGLTFTTKDKKVEVHAPTLGYDRGKTYTLHVTPAVQSSNGIALKQESTKVFTIQ